MNSEMNEIQKLAFMSLHSRVILELQNHLEIRDSTLAEFIIELAKESDNETQFLEKLKENGADFTPQFSMNLFSLIKKFLASIFTSQKFAPSAHQSEEIPLDLDDPSGLGGNELKNFPALTIPDKKPMRGTSQEPKAKKTSKRSRSRSPKKVRKHSRSRSFERPRNKKGHKERERRERERELEKEREPLFEEIETGKIYDGAVTKIFNYGVFVRLSNFRTRKEGLVHISNISHKKITNPEDVLKSGDRVKVKACSVQDNQVRLSLKDVDQETGQERDSSNIFPVDFDEKVQKASSRPHREFGDLTGIKLTAEDKEPFQLKKVRKSSPDLWELSRLKYNSKLSQPNEQIDLQELEGAEEDIEIGINEKEPLFLRGQTTKAGLKLSPVRIVKMPEGTLQRAALNSVALAKERREVKEEQQRQVLDRINKGDMHKTWDDPNADPTARALVAQLKGLGANQVEESVFNPESMFKQAKNVPKSVLSIKEQKESLPIYQYKTELVRAVQENQVLIVIGETGSGKTTQITQYLLAAGFCKGQGKIACTQPRRVAAMSVAKRVAEELGVQIGEEVGYSIRFEDCTGPQTVIKYMTDGMLLREALLDSELKQYSVVMLDEAHERQLGTDVLFGLLKKVAQKRKDFHLIVTSATLDAEKFSSYFFDCKIFRIPGRNFPVEILYSKEPEPDYLDAALIVVMQIHLHEPAGDILLFLTGQEEIDNACQTLHSRMKRLGNEAPELIILPVYSSLPSDMQNRIFMNTPKGSRKCVIATNIAEASLTIDGIYYVVDPGFCKIKQYNPKLGMDSLIIVPISQASARQRAGRAGRTGPGKCYRLYTEAAYKHEMLPTTVPEIQRTNMAHTVLLLKAMGINDLLNFDFMDPPPVQTLIAAMEQLHTLGALDEEGLLTKLGMKMAEFPLEPPMAKMLLTAVDLSCSDEICTIIAMLTVQNVFYRPKDKQGLADEKRAKFNCVEGDHLTFLTVYDAWKNNNFSRIWCHENFIDDRNMRRAQDVRKQLVTILERYRLSVITCGKDYAKIRKAICAGFFFHAAKKDMHQEVYHTLNDDHIVYIHPSSSMYNKSQEWVIYHELVLTSKEYMRGVCAINPKWLIDVAPSYYTLIKDFEQSCNKKNLKLEPLSNKYQDPNAWRLSKRKG